jgi:undecaprenyl phosphate-alpha-L-ara4FN deformylase
MISDAPVYVGLRIDVDTFRGTRDGVPQLCDVLSRRGITGTFFFTLGPDNMGRHLWRLIRPAFLWKMLRSNAPSLYGWDIVLRGTLWPGVQIGKNLAPVIRAAADQGHEVGIHSWDHHAWQMRSDTMSEQDLDKHLSLGVNAFKEIFSFDPQCSAAAGWKCTERALVKKEEYAMRYHSDCRGTHIFRPVVNGKACTPQIPATLPTYDEMVGQNGVTDENFNNTLLDMIKPGQLNVLTIHAEVEGQTKRALFERFLDEAAKRNIKLVPMGQLLPASGDIPEGAITQGKVAGREGIFCTQRATV